MNSVLLLGLQNTRDNFFDEVEDAAELVKSLQELYRGIQRVAKSPKINSKKLSAMCLIGERLASPSAALDAVDRMEGSTTLLVVYIGHLVQSGDDLLLATHSSSSRKRSFLSLALLAERAKESGRFTNSIFTLYALSPSRNPRPSENAVAIYQKNEPRTSKATGATPSASSLIPNVLLEYFTKMPRFSIGDVFRYCNKKRSDDSIDRLAIAGDPNFINMDLLGLNLESPVIRLDSSNFYSLNPGSREDGIQSLKYALSIRKLRQDARFLTEHIAINDDCEKVRQAAAKIGDSSENNLPHPLKDRSLHTLSTLDCRNIFSRLVSVPAGNFIMGSNLAVDEFGLPEEMPWANVFLDSYRISKYQVSEYEWMQFCTATDREPHPGCRDRVDYPVVWVSYYDALDYCAWLTQVLRTRRLISNGLEINIPTEAEWEKAARGTEGRIFPWGDDFDPNSCNFRDSGEGGVVPFRRFTPRGDSPYGIQDMAGNVWEWTRSAWGRWGHAPEYGYPYVPGGRQESADLGSDVRRVIRGGAYYYFDYCLRCATRNVMYPETRHSAGGFRIVLVKSKRVAQRTRLGLAQPLPSINR